ncbi:MAG TPA: NAD(P)H-hydrate epimerase, partial [Candidatus Fraserbacteria bacterium]|nr:NAD(P)H-hydrate epimerase [Candidatus Fraserbacteria bacterium]
MQVLTGTQMKELDSQAIQNYGIPSLILMENAGRSIAEHLANRLLELEGRRVCLVCGKGNNGGDGLVVARQLLRLGAEVSCVVLGTSESLSAETATQASILAVSGTPLRYLSRSSELPALEVALANSELVIDALLGIGVSGAPRG